MKIRFLILHDFIQYTENTRDNIFWNRKAVQFDLTKILLQVK